MKIAFLTLGCKLNYAETSTYERLLKTQGCESVQWSSAEADVYLVNTCSVTEHSDKKSRNIIRKLHRISPSAPIVVTGCSAQLRRTEIEAIEGVAAVFGATQKNMVVPYILSLRDMDDTGRLRNIVNPGRPDGVSADGHIAKNTVTQIVTKADSDIFAAYSSGERTRSFLKVQDGCNNFCSYCTVPYARGRSRNIPIAEAVCQAREIAASGIREIVLTGVNTGDFGRSTGETFFELIKALDKVDGIERYRISSIEPNLLTDEIIDWIAEGHKFVPHFHIPLQSGCDEILRQMGRHYDTEFFAGRIDRIRRMMEKPGGLKVFFGIDLIAGFPGETDEMFEQTYGFLKDRIRPAFIHIFPYSRRPGTPAAERKDQVQDAVKTRRVERLEGLCDELHRDFIDAHKGLKAKVLFESTDRKGNMSGYTENYISVVRPYERAKVGCIEEVIL